MNSLVSTAMKPGQPQLWRTGACAALLAACLVTTAWASSPKVWRCDLGGQIAYADQPCNKLLAPAQAAEALQRSVDAADTRTVEQRREAQAVSRADQALARQMQQERHRRELQTPRASGAAIIGLPPDPLAKPELKKPSMEARPTRQPRTQATGSSTVRTSPSAAPASRRGAG